MISSARLDTGVPSAATLLGRIQAKEGEMWKTEVPKQDLGDNKDNDLGAEQVPVAMAAYRESVDEFARHATEFLEHIPTLMRAREAYQRAISVSSELRNMLDKGDETLKALMDQLEQAISNPALRSGLEKKRPELARVEPIKSSDDEDTEIMRVMP
jgi:hypothetical protein